MTINGTEATSLHDLSGPVELATSVERTLWPNKPLPSGEVGILIRVSCASDVLGTPHCLLVMEWNHQEYFGFLYFDKEEFVQTFVSLAQTQIGRPIEKIGSLDADVA